MNDLPPNGTRVVCKWRDQTVIGTVRRHWPSYRENGSIRPFDPERDSVSVEVDSLPIGWPYKTNRFAPRIIDVQPT